MIKKLSVGTAQMGMAYPAHHQIPRKEADEILNLAWYHGVEHVDTAACYGNAEQIVSEHPMPFKITTKEGDHKSKLNENVHAVLLHDREMQFYRKVMKYYPVKVGMSIYQKCEFEPSTQEERLDVIQCPYSIYDRTFEPYFEVCHKHGIEVQVRSIFSRGKVFHDPDLEAFAQANGFSILSLCVNFALMNPHIDRVIFGVDNIDQFAEIIDAVIDDHKDVKLFKNELEQFEKAVSY